MNVYCINDLCTNSTIFGSWGWSLYTGWTVLFKLRPGIGTSIRLGKTVASVKRTKPTNGFVMVSKVPTRVDAPSVPGTNFCMMLSPFWVEASWTTSGLEGLDGSFVLPFSVWMEKIIFLILFGQFILLWQKTLLKFQQFLLLFKSTVNKKNSVSRNLWSLYLGYRWPLLFAVLHAFCGIENSQTRNQRTTTNN